MLCYVQNPAGSRQKVLVIDDDAEILRATKRMLEREGFDVTTAMDGKEGLHAFDTEGFDLVVTDIIMPEKDGIEVILELKKKAPDARIIAISGGGHLKPEFYLKAAERLEVDLSLTKPLIPGEFLEHIKEVLERKP